MIVPSGSPLHLPSSPPLLPLLLSTLPFPLSFHAIHPSDLYHIPHRIHKSHHCIPAATRCYLGHPAFYRRAQAVSKMASSTAGVHIATAPHVIIGGGIIGASIA